jgi:hypothetical protein
MDFDRNRYFAIGVLLFLLGVQFRMIDSFVLNETSTQAISRMAADSQLASQNFTTSLYSNWAPQNNKRITPPKWLGFALLTVGGVIALHAMVLPKANS